MRPFAVLVNDEKLRLCDKENFKVETTSLAAVFITQSLFVMETVGLRSKNLLLTTFVGVASLALCRLLEF